MNLQHNYVVKEVGETSKAKIKEESGDQQVNKFDILNRQSSINCYAII